MPFIHQIETMVPPTAYPQHELGSLMMERCNDKKTKRYIKAAHDESGILTRYSVLTDFQPSAAKPRLFRHADGSVRKDASTGERNAVFIEEAKRLVPKIAKQTLANCKGIRKEEITHVISVSCTGCFNPGPDLLVVDALGLSPGVQRYQLGFMGCYAALPALRMANQFCEADPNAVALVVCIELCTLHMQDKDDLDTVLANSLFADGLAAALISAKKPAAGTRAFEFSHFASNLAPEGVHDMAWNIGERGFEIVLSKYVSRILGAGILKIVEQAFAGSGHSPGEIRKWAIHPGGRAILDKIEGSLGLQPAQIEASRNTLARFGNMSSATVLFVLAELLKSRDLQDGEAICAMAFGPGLTIETSLLRAVFAPQYNHQARTLTTVTSHSS